MFDDNATSDTLLKFAVNVEGKLVAVVTTPSGDHDNGEEEFERSCDGTDPNDATTEEISVDAMLKVLLSRFAFASRDVHHCTWTCNPGARPRPSQRPCFGMQFCPVFSSNYSITLVIL